MRVNSKMASSPAVGRGTGHFSSPSTSGSKRPLAEMNPRTLVGIQKVNVQLQKELEKLERQQTTAVNNIANHQQAMKMTWRRLEQKRAMDSPQVSRAATKKNEEGGARRSLFQSNTKLYVNKTPDIYNPSKDKDLTGAEILRPTTVHLSPGDAKRRGHHFSSIPVAAENSLINSPYISSPFNYRRSQPSTTSKPPVQNPSLLATNAHEDQTKKKQELKLPPITSASQPLLVTSSTTNKKTLLKASTLLSEEATTTNNYKHTSTSFTDFFASERPSSQASLLISPVQPEGKIITDGQLHQEGSRKTMNSEEDSLQSNSEPTLAEMFEQIKHCRYIRRYHPDGTALEEYY